MTRNRFHSICPYFAMFPEDFVRKYILAWTKPNDLVLDPFCGRGTTILEGLLNGRQAIGCDLNPVAVCLSKAKSNPPRLIDVLDRIGVLRDRWSSQGAPPFAPSEFFAHCFHSYTFSQLRFLREELAWRDSASDCFIAALLLGCLHGESHRSSLCLSNRMPRTISTKPAYSVRWWTQRECVAPRRDTFAILIESARYRFASEPPVLFGHVAEGDARDAKRMFKDYAGQVKLVITSPPYLDVTNYREDQWLRLWFLGGPESPDAGQARDDRHRQEGTYWKFLKEAWRGVLPLLRRNCQIVIRIGGGKLSPERLSKGLMSCLEQTGRRVELVEMHTSAIRGGQHRSFRAVSTIKSSSVEHDFRFCLGGAQ